MLLLIVVIWLALVLTVIGEATNSKSTKKLCRILAIITLTGAVVLSIIIFYEVAHGSNFINRSDIK